MITVASFHKPEEAHLLRMRLEAGGVPAVVLDQDGTHTEWTFSNSTGNVKVVVEEADAQAAREILETPSADLPPDCPVCPSCSSTNTAPGGTPRHPAFLSLFVAPFSFFLSGHRWQCADCGWGWNERTGRGSSSGSAGA